MYTYVLKEASSCGFPLEDLKVLKLALSCTSSNTNSQFWTKNLQLHQQGRKKEEGARMGSTLNTSNPKSNNDRNKEIYALEVQKERKREQ
jgi:hypothetical protein